MPHQSGFRKKTLFEREVKIYLKKVYVVKVAIFDFKYPSYNNKSRDIAHLVQEPPRYNFLK